MKVLVPMSGSDAAFRDAGYPRCKSLIEINGKAIIQHIYENLLSLKPTSLSSSSARRTTPAPSIGGAGFAGPGCQVIVAEGNTAGAACTALLAIASSARMKNSSSPTRIRSSAPTVFHHPGIPRAQP